MLDRVAVWVRPRRCKLKLKRMKLLRRRRAIRRNRIWKAKPPRWRKSRLRPKYSTAILPNLALRNTTLLSSCWTASERNTLPKSSVIQRTCSSASSPGASSSRR